MNPELPQVRRSVESLPTPGNGEFRVESGEQRQEAEQSAEQRVIASSDAAMQAMAAALPVQDDDGFASPVAQAVPPSATSDAPLIAGDDDLIEKEWVDKLKRIIVLTRDDPYERARVIAQLQADYLKKRYNREIGRTSG